MKPSTVDAASSIGRDVGKNVALVFALAIVFVMVATSFYSFVAYAEDVPPAVWTSQDEYAPGETVFLFGSGWTPLVPVTLTLSHSDLGVKMFSATPASDGCFVFNGYVAEPVTVVDEPVVVTATQTYMGAELSATTVFYDPAVSIQGWDLWPWQRFTYGDVNGYYEGDSIPFMVLLESRKLADEVTVTVAVDYCDYNGPPDDPTYGIDYLTEYWDPTPNPPFNGYPESDAPFWVDPAEGSIVDQWYVGELIDEDADEGGYQSIKLWTFVFNFDDDARVAHIRFGAHLAVTTEDMLGASYYPGAALHVRLYDVLPDTSSDEGHRDVPIMLGILQPPEMTLDKICDPCEVVEGDIITFTVHYTNEGQADAYCVEMWDVLDPAAEIISGSFMYWDSYDMDPTPVDWPILDPTGFHWTIGYVAGTETFGDTFEAWLQFQAVVVTDEPGCYYNNVWLSYSDGHGGEYDDLHAWCVFCIPSMPAIDIEKYGPDYAHVGDIITYTYVVTNTGLVDLHNVDIIDDVAGVIALDQALAAGEVRTYTKSYTITALDLDPLKNTVTVSGDDNYGRTVGDCDDWVVDILHPEIQVEKSADLSCAEEDEKVVFTIVVRNPSSDTVLYDVSVVDSIIGVLDAVEFGPDWDGILLPYEFDTAVVSIPASEYYNGDPMVNEVVAEGTDLLDLTVSDKAKWEVDIQHPDIRVTKEANLRCAEPGETIEYYISVENPSIDTDMYVRVWDYMFDLLDPIYEGWIPYGTTYYHPVLTYVPSYGEEVVRNTVWVDAIDDQNHYVCAWASWDVEIFYPMIDVDKWAVLETGGLAECAEPGETIYYYILVSNPSWDDTMYVWVNDSMLSDEPLYVGYVLYDDSVLLGPFPYEVPECEWVVNTVTVDAYDHQDHYRYAEASWRVEVFHPGIEITKEGNVTCAAEGETVQYWINVTNPSYDTYMTATVWDYLISLDPLVEGKVLAPLEVLLLGPYKYQVPFDTDADIVNTAYVCAYDHQGHERSASDSWSVDVVHPDVDIEKTADLGCAGVGETVRFTITVTNPATADVWLNGTVYDDALGEEWEFDELKPGESEEFVVDFPMPEGPTEFINTACVVAFDHQLHKVVDEASVRVDIVHPDVVLTKVADKACAAVGELVVYTITVTNPETADIPISGIVRDDKLGWIESFFDLAVGDSKSWKVGFRMVDGPDSEFWNDAYVRAEDPQGHIVEDWASVRVDVVHPAVSITKEANLTCAAVGEEVKFYINVTNDSPDVWLNGTVYDEALGDSWKFYSLLPGVTFPIVVYARMPAGVDYFINTAEVVAYDHQEHEVTDVATVGVDVVHPMVEIEKVADKPCAAVGEPVTYTITVTNPAASDVWLNGTVVDKPLGWSATFYELKPGQSESWRVTVLMPDPEESVFWNFVEVHAYDHQLHEVYDWASVMVDVVHPGIEITKSADPDCVHVGDEVTFTITVSVPLWVDVLMSGTVDDPALGFSASFSGMAAGDSTSWYPTYIALEEDAPVFENTAYVTAWDHQLHYLYDDASASVNILIPLIDIEKTGPEYAAIGQVITYTVVVTNIGNTPLYDVEIYDDLLGGVVKTYPMLDVWQSETWSYTFEVPPGEGPLVNTATATGYDCIDGEATDSDSWTVIKLGEVNGYKFADLNRDAFKGVIEPGLVSWEIVLTGILDDGSYFEPRTTYTNSLGYYSFTGLKPGAYTVTETLPAGWHHYTPLSYALDINSGTVLPRDFGNLPFGSISGYKWHDLDIDGVWDDGEPGIPDWGIYLKGLDVNGDPVSLSTMTDGSGYYIFEDLLPGDYVVCEELVDGWYATTLTQQDVPVPELVPFEVTDRDFGNAKLGEICGYKWLDEWMNGIWDGDEPGLPGWTIELTGTLANGEPFGPIYTVTVENGYYYFGDLLPGVYVVREIMQPGWTHITQDSWEVTIGESTTVFCAKFGNVPYGEINGWKWLDWDMDGIIDDEPGLGGWAITLEGWLNDGVPPYSYDGTYVGPFTIFTEPNGYWEFPDLLPGIYRVTEEDRAGWFNTTPLSRLIMVTPGKVVFDVKFGNVPYTCLWGYKYEDLNANGQKDEGEPGLPGWHITVVGLRNDDVPVELEFVTDEFGYWATCFNILPGTYVISEVMQDGWEAITPAAYKFTIPVAREPMAYEFSFGNFELGRIFGCKYEDVNGDGKLDGGDNPLPDWMIWIRYPDGSLDYTFTGPDGCFSFTGLLYGMYYVYEEMQAGWTPSSATGHWIFIDSGDEERLPPFLNLRLGSIEGYKWEDLDGDGIWDDGELGIPDWPIYMIWDEDPVIYQTTTDGSGHYIFPNLWPSDFYMVYELVPADWTATTPQYHVRTLNSGDHLVLPAFGNYQHAWITVFKYEDMDHSGTYDEMIDQPVPGWHITVSGPAGTFELVTGTDGYASVLVNKPGVYTATEEDRRGWCHVTPATVEIEVVSGMADPRVAMFGNFECVYITFFKYEDVDSDGRYNPDVDNPVDEWTFYFRSMGGASFEAETDINGLAVVEFCTADIWMVTEEMEDGWCLVSPETGSYMFQTVSGISWNLDTQMEQYWYEFGNFRCVEIDIFKFWDKCSDGFFSPGLDEPLGGWYFEIIGIDVEYYNYGWTYADGHLSFTVCQAGTYLVREWIQEGWTPILPLEGYYLIDVVSGMEVIPLPFANYRYVDVPIFKYEDVNSDGDYDPGLDEPLDEWYFELIRHGDGYVFSGYTGPDGKLVLSVNRSGTYTLREEDRLGWSHINPLSGEMLLSIVGGTEVTEKQFGNFRDVLLTVFKFEDIVGDGQCDYGDTGLEGWTFTVYGPGLPAEGVEITTDGSGYASLVVNRAGTYTVVETMQPGWTPTTATTQTVDVTSGYISSPVLWFGNWKWFDITVFKYNDVNGDGTYNAGDAPLSGWTIELWIWSFFDVYVEVGVTDDTGHVTFTVKTPGYHEIHEVLQDGWCIKEPMSHYFYGYYWFYAESGDVYDEFRFGNFRCVYITVFKYEDKDSDGVYDDGSDTPIDEWWIDLYLDGLWYAGDYTDNGGYAYFEICDAGHYLLVEEMWPGWVTPITPPTGTYEFDVVSGSEFRTFEFGNFFNAWIPVFKYEDVNSNGMFDGDDVPVPDWEFSISGPGVMNPTAVTDGGGFAWFMVNRAGWYTVTEELKPGWIHINPADGMLSAYVESGDCHELLQFGNFRPVDIWVFKFDDVYADGQYCPAEGDKPLPDWVFELYLLVGDEWMLIETQVTGPDGYAHFVLERAGTYKVAELEVTGWFWIYPDDGCYIFSVVSGSMPRELWFANFKFGKVYGYKWNDLDGDGEKDDGEPGLPGWTIWIETYYDDSMHGFYLLRWEITDEDGYYEFTGLPPGTYKVWEVGQAGWVPTSPSVQYVTVVGHSELRIDFFNFKLGCVEGYKYEDMNGDGKLDDGDTVLPEWQIYLSKLIDDELVVIASTVTDGSGYYRFCGLGPGHYMVSEGKRTGWVPTNAPTEEFDMISGALLTMHVFLNFELGSITGYKFEDLNSNGVWDAGEPAREGWPINLLRDSEPGWITTYTDGSGRYSFTGLDAEYYLVWEEQLDGWTHTNKNYAEVWITSGTHVSVPAFGNFRNVTIELFKYEDVNGNGVFDNGDDPLPGWEFEVSGPCFPVPKVVVTDAGGWAVVYITEAGDYVITEEARPGWVHTQPESGAYEFSVVSGTSLAPFVFGNCELSEVTGLKFHDWNKNGLREPGEEGLVNWIIELEGWTYAGDYVLETDYTESDGSYSFENLMPGAYTVRERLDLAPPGWSPTTPPAVPIELESGSAEGVSFGNIVTGLILGYKFYDKNMDGYWDYPDEPGLGGWAIHLTGHTDKGEPVDRTEVTDGYGYYEFDMVQPGEYEITETILPDWTNTTELPQKVDVSGTMAYFEVWVHIGNVRYAMIWGYKFLDSYEDRYPFWPNGIQDEDEYGLGNWEITLQGWNVLGERVDEVEYTYNGPSADPLTGYYEFTGLLPGTYWVNETLLWGYYATRPICNLVTIMPFPYGVVVFEINFGNLLPAPDPEMNFVLETGGNLWSSALYIEGFHASDLAAAIGPTCTKISMYNAVLKKYQSFIPAYPSTNDFVIEHGTAYLVFVTGKTAFTLTGDLVPGSSKTLVTGGNLVGYNNLRPILASELASMADGCTVTKVSYYDTVEKKWKAFIPGLNKAGGVYDFTVTQGRGYLIMASGPGALDFGLEL